MTECDSCDALLSNRSMSSSRATLAAAAAAGAAATLGVTLLWLRMQPKTKSERESENESGDGGSAVSDGVAAAPKAATANTVLTPTIVAQFPGRATVGRVGVPAALSWTPDDKVRGALLRTE